MTRFLFLLIPALSCIADVNTGDVRGTVFTVDSNGSRSVVVGAKVELEGSLPSVEAITDGKGTFSFIGVAPATYHIDVTAAGLAGAEGVTVAPGVTVDIPIEVKIEAIRQSVTVEGTEDPAIPPYPS